jgi:hypothetical protein
MLLGAARMILHEASKDLKVLQEPIQDPVYKLTIFPAPDEKMVVIPKKERTYSTNPRHSKVPRKK